MKWEQRVAIMLGSCIAVLFAYFFYSNEAHVLLTNFMNLFLDIHNRKLVPVHDIP